MTWVDLICLPDMTCVVCEQVETESELQALCGDVFPRFVYSSLDGREVELLPGGHHTAVR